MTIHELETPAVLTDLDILEANIRRYCREAARYGKQVWPMVKTHKSTEIARMQADAGCTGFLCGTLDECEALADAGFENIMYAYPVSDRVSVLRAAALARRCRFCIRLDCRESAEAVSSVLAETGGTVRYTVIVDSGLHRFGVPPEQAAEFVRSLSGYPHLVFAGVSSHPGHVYAASGKEGVRACAEDECRAIRTAVSVLRAEGLSPEIVSSGSTPTFPYAAADENIRILHPGNYVFQDAIQTANGTAEEADCALTVLASVISSPREGLFICDAGAKCLGLDLGAHGNTSIRGYGTVAGHPELTLFSLSEEVGKIRTEGKTDLRVGDRIRIIPNHACSCANLTGYLIGVREETVERLIGTDIRGNSTRKGF